MLEFFRGWKRKVGCMTLVMACVFAAGWVRNLYYFDQILLPDIDQQKEGILHSQGGSFRWTRIRKDFPSGQIPLWLSRLIITMPEHEIVPKDSSPGVQWRWRFMGFGHGTLGTGGSKRPFYCCPYWLIVLPLTAISAWLLLSKPRTKPEPAITHASENA